MTGAPDSTELLREETFGPVAPIVPVDSLDEAIRLANATRFGLGANVNDAGPFGGMKQSGFGRELGQEGLEAFQDAS